MNLLIINGVAYPKYKLGGTAYTTYYLGQALANKGENVVVACWNKSDTYFSKEQSSLNINNRFSIIYFPKTSIWNFIQSIKKLYAQIKNSDRILLNTAWQSYGLVAYACLKILKREYILYPHGSFDEGVFNGWKKRIFFYFFDKQIATSSKVVVALNAREQNSLRKLGITNSRIIQNGVAVFNSSSTFIPPKVLEKKEFILFLGRIVEKKGVLELIGAFDLIKHSGSNLMLVMAGPVTDTMESRLKGLSKFSSEIVFIGPVMDDLKWWLYENTNVFVLPSFSEGQPIALLEALSKGAICCASKACGVNVEFTRGIVIDNVVAKDIADGIMHCIGLKNNGFKKESPSVVKSWDQVADETLKILYD